MRIYTASKFTFADICTNLAGSKKIVVVSCSLPKTRYVNMRIYTASKFTFADIRTNPAGYEEFVVVIFTIQQGPLT